MMNVVKFWFSCINLKKKPFLEFEEIVNTCHDYGYDILKLPKVKLSTDFNRETDERCCILISTMEGK